MSVDKHKLLSADTKENYGTNTVFEAGQIETSNKELTIVHDIRKKPKFKKAFTGNHGYKNYKLVDIILIKATLSGYVDNFKVKVEYHDRDDFEFNGWISEVYHIKSTQNLFFALVPQKIACCRILCGHIAKTGTKKNNIPKSIKFIFNNKEIVIDPEHHNPNFKSDEKNENWYEFYKEQIKIYSSWKFPDENTCSLMSNLYDNNNNKSNNLYDNAFLYKCLENNDIKLPNAQYNEYEHNIQFY
eukprot:156677_1